MESRTHARQAHTSTRTIPPTHVTMDHTPNNVTPDYMSPRTTSPTHIPTDPPSNTHYQGPHLWLSPAFPTDHTSIHVFLPWFSSLVFVQVFVLLLEFLRPLGSLGSLLLGCACGWLLLCTSALPGSVSHCMNLSEAP